MQKRIKLNYNMGNFLDGATLINLDEDLELIIEYEKPLGAKMYYCASNGGITKKGLIENNTFILKSDFIKLGSLNIKIEIEMFGSVIKVFTIEPLLVYELDETIEAIPQMIEMENKIKTLTEKVEVLTNRLDFFVKLWKEEI